MTETPMRRPGPTSAPRNAPPPRPPRPVRDEAARPQSAAGTHVF